MFSFVRRLLIRQYLDKLKNAKIEIWIFVPQI